MKSGKGKNVIQPTADQIKEASSKIAGYFGGYFAVWTIDLGVRTGLFAEIVKYPNGITSSVLAKKKEFDALNVDVWCRNAYGAELLEIQNGRYILSPAMKVILFDRDSPAYATGTAQALIGLRDIFVALRKRMKSGDRLWWDSAPREFVDAVAESSRAFYTRLLNFIDQKKKLSNLLNKGTLLEVGSGYGSGLIRFAKQYPNAKLIGVDGDKYSIKQAKSAFKHAKISNQIRFVTSTFEDYNESEVADFALINISLHEARNKRKVVKAMHNALKPGGVILVSEFPYPEVVENLRTPPSRVMSGVQYFEAMIDDQLLPTKEFVSLLNGIGFKNIEVVELAPVHVVILGYKY